MTERDILKSRVYAAQQLVHAVFDNADKGATREVTFFGTKLTVPTEAKFASLPALESYVASVQDFARVKEIWPHISAPLRVRVRRGNSSAHYSRKDNVGEIAIPDSRWALRELVVLHELAHHLERGDHAAHGKEFQDTFAQLAGMVMGPEVTYLLRVAFHRECAP